MVLQPPGTAWPQESPRLAPWVLFVSIEQSSCEFFGAFAPHLHPWSHHLFPLVDDEEIHLDHVNALECSLHIHTHDLITSSPPSMMRKAIWTSWSYICVYMIDCHYVSSHQKHVFWFHISKNKKKLNHSKIKSGFGILYICLHKLLLEVRACLDHCKIQSLHRHSHLWWSAVTAPM